MVSSANIRAWAATAAWGRPRRNEGVDPTQRFILVVILDVGALRFDNRGLRGDRCERGAWAGAARLADDCLLLGEILGSARAPELFTSPSDVV